MVVFIMDKLLETLFDHIIYVYSGRYHCLGIWKLAYSNCHQDNR
jgi:hypothetical protein